MTKIVGYARVSTSKQEESLNLQIESLKRAGCSEVFSEVASGAKTDRAVLSEVLGQLQEGDVLVVTALDRLGRNSIHLQSTVGHLVDNGVQFRSLRESVFDMHDRKHAKFMLTILSALADMERETIAERTRTALEALKAQGVPLGRTPIDQVPARMRTVRRAFKLRASGLSCAEVGRAVGVSKATAHRWFSDPRFSELAREFPVSQNA